MPLPKEGAVPFQEENIRFDINFLTCEDKECPLNGLTVARVIYKCFKNMALLNENFVSRTMSLHVTFSELGDYMLFNKFQFFLQLEDSGHLLLRNILC